MDRYAVTIHISHHSITELWFTAFGKFVWDIGFSSDNEFRIFSWNFGFFHLFLFLFQILRFSYMLKLYRLVLEYPSDNRRWLTREIPQLEEDIFFSLGIENSSIHMFENRKVFVEHLSEVLLEIGIENKFPFFDELVPIGSVNLGLDTLFCSCCFDK